ncbi:MAG: hypothetical protein Fur005_17850 [Roseiflexaceae bacterium]
MHQNIQAIAEGTLAHNLGARLDMHFLNAFGNIYKITGRYSREEIDLPQPFGPLSYTLHAHPYATNPALDHLELIDMPDSNTKLRLGTRLAPVRLQGLLPLDLTCS